MANPKPAKRARRKLRFATLEDILADAQDVTAGPYQTVGNWSAGQILDHIGRTIHQSVHGFDAGLLPLPIRLLLRLGLPIVLRQGFPAGTRFPRSAATTMTPDDLPVPEALKRLQDAIDAAQTNGMNAPDPLVGRLTDRQWHRLHCRHAELHFSFIVHQTTATE